MEQERSSEEWAILVAAGLLGAASFMPWATLGPFSVSGIDGGDGWITLASGIGLGVLAWVKQYLWSAVAGAVGLAVAAHDFLEVATEYQNTYSIPQVGIGLVVSVLAAQAAVVLSVLHVRHIP